MKSFRILIILILMAAPIHADSQHRSGSARTIVVLPIYSSGIDTVYVQTAESILRTEVAKLSPMELVSMRRMEDVLQGTTCIERECALDIGEKLEATEVLGCRLSALGDKVVVQYFLVNVPAGKEVLIDQITATSVNDLDILMKRLAKSAVNVESIESNAEVGRVLPSESIPPLRRMTRKNFGVSFGYLYPQSGYDSGERSFIVDGRFDYELQDYAVGMLIGIRKGFATNLYGSYLLSRGDFCPYVGGSAGFHWVSHSYYAIPNEYRSDGLEFSAHAGLRVLHTYNFQMIFNLEYTVTVNDFHDKAVVFTIGIL